MRRWSNLNNIFSWVEITKYQGIVGCTSTNVPLWEIPIKALYSGYFLAYNPQKNSQRTPARKPWGTPNLPFLCRRFGSKEHSPWSMLFAGQRHKHQPSGRNCSPTLGWEWQENPWVIGEIEKNILYKQAKYIQFLQKLQKFYLLDRLLSLQKFLLSLCYFFTAWLRKTPPFFVLVGVQDSTPIFSELLSLEPQKETNP